jgi:hypothetical protein
MAQRPTVRWNESAQRWMAWVRSPDGSRRKVERVDKAAAQWDLDKLIALRAQSLDPARLRIIDAELAKLTPSARQTPSRDASLFRRAPRQDRPAWLDRVPEVAPRPGPGPDRGQGIDLGL